MDVEIRRAVGKDIELDRETVNRIGRRYETLDHWIIRSINWLITWIYFGSPLFLLSGCTFVWFGYHALVRLGLRDDLSLLISGAALISVCVGIYWICRRIRRSRIRRAASDCGVPICRRCGYLVEGLEACPECGRRR